MSPSENIVDNHLLLKLDSLANIFVADSMVLTSFTVTLTRPINLKRRRHLRLIGVVASRLICLLIHSVARNHLAS